MTEISPQVPRVALYMAPGACSLAPHIMLREAGVPFELVKHTVRGGFPADFHELNPKMRIPVLVVGEGDGRQVITEMPAVLTAIAQLAPSRDLLGKADIEVVRTYEWLNYLSGTLHGQAFGCLFRPGRFINDPSLEDKIRAKGRKSVEQCFDHIENTLTGIHAVGNGSGAVDIFLYVFWRWGCQNGIEMQKYTKYAGLIQELMERDSVKAAVAEEGIEAYSPRDDARYSHI
jgi:glutathione S-transferase